MGYRNLSSSSDNNVEHIDNRYLGNIYTLYGESWAIRLSAEMNHIFHGLYYIDMILY